MAPQNPSMSLLLSYKSTVINKVSLPIGARGRSHGSWTSTWSVAATWITNFSMIYARSWASTWPPMAAQTTFSPEDESFISDILLFRVRVIVRLDSSVWGRSLESFRLLYCPCRWCWAPHWYPRHEHYVCSPGTAQLSSYAPSRGSGSMLLEGWRAR